MQNNKNMSADVMLVLSSSFRYNLYTKIMQYKSINTNILLSVYQIQPEWFQPFVSLDNFSEISSFTFPDFMIITVDKEKSIHFSKS